VNNYDTIIIGGGPAGLSAGIYAMRSRLKALLVEKFMPGGQMMITDFVENFPGFPAGICGADLGMAMSEQARSLGLEIISSDCISADFSGAQKLVRTPDGDFSAPTAIIACGATPRRLKVPGEGRLTGKGVSYCATCDGAFFKDKEIAVVGGGNTAIQDAVFLTRFANKVTILHRRDALRATKILQERAQKNPKVEIAWNTVVTEIKGEQKVESLILKNINDESERALPVDGIFVLIGTVPNTEFLHGQVVMDPAGYVITNEEMETSVAGVYAAGDCRHKMLRQMVTAAADGAIAATAAEQYIESLEDRAH
jgi:thioredoxin reductase (NADPH)